MAVGLVGTEVVKRLEAVLVVEGVAVVDCLVLARRLGLLGSR